MPALLAATLLACIAIDGDTLCCRTDRGAPIEKVRLLGLDAPETRGHCRRGRRCAPGDPLASKRAMAAMVDGKRVRLERHGFDHYGRTLAFAFVDRLDLGCAQLRRGHAIYKPGWDRYSRMRRCS